MLYLPKFYKNLNEIFLRKYFEKFNLTKYNSDSLCKIQTGFTLANIETFFICPLERLKVFLMTHSSKDKIKYSFLRHFYVVYKGNVTKQLFKGLEPSLLRSNISWISFLYLDNKTRSFLREIRKVDNLDFRDLMFASIIVGVGNLTLSKLLLF